MGRHKTAPFRECHFRACLLGQKFEHVNGQKATQCPLAAGGQVQILVSVEQRSHVERHLKKNAEISWIFHNPGHKIALVVPLVCVFKL